MIAELVAIGTELLLGQTANTDAQLLSQALAELGVDVYRHVTVGDNLTRAVEALTAAKGRADVVITSGGLGPTYDDITREAVARAAGRPLVYHEEALEQIQGWFQRRGLSWNELNRRQALIPEGAELLPNRRGTAPGFWLPGPPIFVALPGPPRELEAMFRTEVAPRLAALSQAAIVSRIVKVVGIGESYLEPQLHDLFQASQPTVAPYAKLGEVHLRVTAKAPRREEGEALVAPVVAEIRRRLGWHAYGEGEETLASAILRRLSSQGLSLAVAESATGGLVSARLTEVPGASQVLTGAVVAYQGEAKERLLRVPHRLLAEEGPVSRAVAEELARQVRSAFGADVGLATVGWAGPSGEDVGLTFHAVADRDGVAAREERFSGDRQEVRLRLAQAALVGLWRHLAAREADQGG
jgi:nicotinamide-nucleotide amidase